MVTPVDVVDLSLRSVVGGLVPGARARWGRLRGAAHPLREG
jgi:hypothetical protein